MKFSDYIIKYNMQFGLDDEKTIALNEVDLSADESAGLLMDAYVQMLEEKVERKQALRNQEAFELSGMSQDEKHIFDSVAGVYIYENQFERKELQEDIAELVSLSMMQVKEIAMASVQTKQPTKEEKSKLAKLLSIKNEELEPNA